MKVNKDDIDFVDAKLQRQNALLATVGISVLVMPLVLSWYVVFRNYPSFSPIMMLVSGVLIGLTTRWLGKGYSNQFATLAFLTHLIVVLSAFYMGITFEGRLRGFILFGLYVMGAWGAIYLSKIDIGHVKYKAFYQLAIVNKHNSYRKLKNRWFISIPLLLLLALPTAYLSLNVMTNLYFVDLQQQQLQQIQDQENRLENRNIDVSHASLERYSTRQALLYAYAYSSGDLASANGRYIEEFPISTYKSKAILRYLAQERENTRAMFILAMLTDGTKSRKWLEQASEAGDQFAQFYSMVEFGCKYDEQEASKLLEGSYKLAKEDALKFEITRVFQYGFEPMCNSELRQFQYSYIRDYSAI